MGFWGKLFQSADRSSVDITNLHPQVNGEYTYSEWASDPSQGLYVYYGPGGQLITDQHGGWRLYDHTGDEIAGT
jgi:hypothetical protein